MGMHNFGVRFEHDYLTASAAGTSGIADILIPISTLGILQAARLPFLED